MRGQNVRAVVMTMSLAMAAAAPIVDVANGGSAVEWNKGLDGVLALDFELAIAGRGEL